MQNLPNTTPDRTDAEGAMKSCKRFIFSETMYVAIDNNRRKIPDAEGLPFLTRMCRKPTGAM